MKEKKLLAMELCNRTTEEFTKCGLVSHPTPKLFCIIFTNHLICPEKKRKKMTDRLLVSLPFTKYGLIYHPTPKFSCTNY